MGSLLRSGRPDIVLILADDLGFSDIGCCGGEIETPTLDALASRGVLMPSFYNNAVCMPTRASLLTGLYAMQAASGRGYQLRTDNNVTIAELLAAAGYRTFLSGKWHNGTEPDQLPWTRGFRRFYGLLSGSSNYFNPGLPRPGEPAPAHKRPGDMRPWGVANQVVHPYNPEAPDFYATDAFTDAACEFIGSCRTDEPYFLYLAYTAPHFPMQARPDDIQKYRGRYLIGWDEVRARRLDRLKASGIAGDGWSLPERDDLAPAWEDCADKDRWDLTMAVYAAMVDRMDRGIGRVLAKVREMGREDNTLVLFLSDNGGCGERINATPAVAPGPVDSYCSVGAPWANASNTPFRRYKVFTHEGGIATPMIASWPVGMPRPGRIERDAGHVMDLMPTILEAAGADYPDEFAGHSVLPCEGQSLLPALRDEIRSEPERALFWEFHGCRAARVGRWKIVSQGPARLHVNIPITSGSGAWELYNLVTDRCETRDLSGSHPKIVKELEQLWLDWDARCRHA